MKLIDLEPKFLKLESADVYGRQDELAGADGLWLLCPKCRSEQSSAAGVHGVICWRPHVPQTIGPKPGRWEFKGTGYADLSLVAGSSSIQLSGGCNAHFFITDGVIVKAW